MLRIIEDSGNKGIFTSEKISILKSFFCESPLIFLSNEREEKISLTKRLTLKILNLKDNKKIIGNFREKKLRITDELIDISSSLLGEKSLEEIRRIYGVVDRYRIGFHKFERVTCSNLFEEMEIGVGLYKTISFINHSCKPNTKLLTKNHSSGEVVLFSLIKIEEGEEILISYLSDEDLFLKKEKRRDLLKKKFGFLCNCKRCKEEE